MYSICFVFFKQKTAYEMRISDWSSDVCSSDLPIDPLQGQVEHRRVGELGDDRTGRRGDRGARTPVGTGGAEDRQRHALASAAPRRRHQDAFVERGGPPAQSLPRSSQPPPRRTEERSVGKGCVKTVKSRGCPEY